MAGPVAVTAILIVMIMMIIMDGYMILVLLMAVVIVAHIASLRLVAHGWWLQAGGRDGGRVLREQPAEGEQPVQAGRTCTGHALHTHYLCPFHTRNDTCCRESRRRRPRRWIAT